MREPQRFRRKPQPPIEAEQFWPETNPLPFADRAACCFDRDFGWFVTTTHGQRTRIVEGDWIVPEPDGRGFYPVKPHIFTETYEPVPLLPVAAPLQARIDEALEHLKAARLEADKRGKATLVEYDMDKRISFAQAALMGKGIVQLESPVAALETGTAQADDVTALITTLTKWKDEGIEDECTCSTAFKGRHQGEPNCPVTDVLIEVLDKLNAAPAPETSALVAKLQAVNIALGEMAEASEYRGERNAIQSLSADVCDVIAALARPEGQTPPSPPSLETECCAKPIAADQRFCPKCGYEALVADTPTPSPAAPET